MGRSRDVGSVNMKRLATIDIGTNTVLLLVAEAEHSGALRVIEDKHEIARLGENVDKTRVISEAAYDRFARVMSRHKETLEDLDVVHIAAFATSAMRDASNKDAILKRAETDFGIEIELLPGK